MIVHARRAAAILFDLACSLESDAPILLPANVCDVVPLTLTHAGRRFEFVDIDDDSLGMDRDQAAARVAQRRHSAVLYVRPYGSLRDVDPFFSRLKRLDPKLLLIDDRCLCPPDVEGSSLSPHADLTLFSTGRAKYADLGGGGFAHLREGVSLPSRQSAADAPSWLDLRAPDQSWQQYSARVLQETTASAIRKAELNAIYRRLIPAHVQLPDDLCQWRFNIRVARAEALEQAIFAEQLFASRHYSPAPKAFGDTGAYLVAAALHAEIVNLFNDRYFDRERATRVAAIVRAHILS